MNPYIAIGTYLVIWWTVIFAVLPWGLRRDEAPVPGQDPGAPSNPRLGLKLAVTTLISAVVWGLLALAYWFREYGS
ncbi:MAG: DUF1467 family protein [Pseudomonadota bacterium]|nr:DUF1467 family protein [Pseudomonadota bacterium]